MLNQGKLKNLFKHKKAVILPVHEYQISKHHKTYEIFENMLILLHFPWQAYEPVN